MNPCGRTVTRRAHAGARAVNISRPYLPPHLPRAHPSQRLQYAMSESLRGKSKIPLSVQISPPSRMKNPRAANSFHAKGDAESGLKAAQLLFLQHNRLG